MIYLDNSATSYPKPLNVMKCCVSAFNRYGANMGRSAYPMAQETSEQIYLCRKKVKEFFNAPKIENVVFTYNCTSALNYAIKGIANEKSHFIISDLEHNAVLRPAHELSQKGVCSYSIAEVSFDDSTTVNNFKKCIQQNTTAIICTGASNVFGIKTPIRLISKLAKDYGLKLVVDGAQIAGVSEIDMKENNIDILCCAGHKGLYSPSGIGLMVLGNDVEIDTIIEGGTGSSSANYNQPNIMPDRFESGTPNIMGILGLSAGIDFIKKIGIDNIYKNEMKLIKRLYYSLRNNSNVQLYIDLEKYRCVPILSFNVNGCHSEEIAYQLSQKSICTRAGLHCAPLAHKKFNTLESGTVRISPSYFTKNKDINFLLKSLNKIAK